MLSQIRYFLFKNKKRKLKSNLLISRFSTILVRKSRSALLSPPTPPNVTLPPHPTSYSGYHKFLTPWSPFAFHSFRPTSSLTAPWTLRTCCAAWKPSSLHMSLWCLLGRCTRPCRVAEPLHCGRTGRAWFRCGSGYRHCVTGSSSGC